MSQLWLVTLPEKDGRANHLRQTLAREQAGVFKFETPGLSIGTLDSLMALTDDLIKINIQVESVLKKIERQYYDVAENTTDALKIGEKSVLNYVTNFQWDVSRYKVTGVSMMDIVSQITSTIGGVDEELKKLTTVYTEKNQYLAACQRKKMINLATSDFEDFLTPQKVAEIGVLDSEFLVTLMCAVPAAIEQDFLKSYFTIGSDIAAYGNPEWSSNSQNIGVNDGNFGPRAGALRGKERGSPIVPGSAKKIYAEGEMVLYSITSLKGQYEAGISSNKDEFTQGKFVDYMEPLILAAREKRYIIRPFTYDSSKAGGVESNIAAAAAQVAKLQVQIVSWCRSHFGEVYTGWIHLKVIRAYAESILRYGVPAEGKPKYIFTFIQPMSKLEKATTDNLARFVTDNYPELRALSGDENEEEDTDSLPFVCYQFSLVGTKSN